MNNIDKDVNTLIMREVGLEVGPGGRICDQDSGMPIKIYGMEVVAQGVYAGKQAIEFDPYNNRRMMGYIFNYFIDKQYEETGVEVIAYYNKDDNPSGGKIECKLDDNTVLTSAQYTRDTLKYTDIIMRLNGENNPNLEQYDLPMTKETVVIPIKKKR